MTAATAKLIAQIGATDQQYLQHNTPTLALQRGELRLQLVDISHSNQEKTYFLQEAIVLLETARVEFEEMPLSLYLALSVQLAKTYMVYYEITQQSRFALITQQILKPLAHYQQDQQAEIYFYLAYAAHVKQEPALCKHWLKKYVQCPKSSLQQLQQHPAFMPLHTAQWFKDLLKSRMC
ncbi:hypothetical protein [Acinetobacter larvae]|uniref:Uncharacterized protein n=1 Tax=Acinetobacter larvae TaxID=1789224 RepID=A0A1B2M2I5_9GAMM|nr:hypothetical protein [Acinetobacter larvae]AOA59389.1 hypothetical protein BFG52_14210 [Acinetobacter larvae]